MSSTDTYMYLLVHISRSSAPQDHVPRPVLRMFQRLPVLELSSWRMAPPAMALKAGNSIEGQLLSVLNTGILIAFILASLHFANLRSSFHTPR